jgi:hypothetical protein
MDDFADDQITLRKETETKEYKKDIESSPYVVVNKENEILNEEVDYKNLAIKLQEELNNEPKKEKTEFV